MIQLETKTEFLNPAEIHGAYSDCIDKAMDRLTMVMPWYTPSPQIRDQLFGMLGRDVALTLVTRPPAEAKNREHEQHLRELVGRQRRVRRSRMFGLGTPEEFPLLEVLLVDNVHAKTIIQDARCVVVSSTNLNVMSIGRNTEFGIRSRESSVVEKALQAVENLRTSDRCDSMSNGRIRPCGCGHWLLGDDRHSCRSAAPTPLPSPSRPLPRPPSPTTEVADEKKSSAPAARNAGRCPNCGKPKKPFYPLCFDCNAAKKGK